MKRLKAAVLAIALASIFPSFSMAQDMNKQWVWTSGEVKCSEINEKTPFNLGITADGYNVGDKVKVTFSSYKVTLAGLTPGTTFSKWSCKVKLLYKDGHKWLPIVPDTNDRINKPFVGVNNNPSDSLTNYSFVVTIPKSRRFTITVEPDNCGFENIKGPGKPMFLNGYSTFITTIKGIDVEKL